MRTALLAIIIANTVCAFDASMSSSSNTYKNLSSAVVTYVELKDVSGLKEPSYINRLMNIENIVYSLINICMITSLLLNGAKEGATENELKSYLDITDKISLNEDLANLTYLNGIGNIELHLETAVYVQNSVELTADFSSICINNFNCLISKVDFRNNEHVTETINLWAQKATNYNMLDHVISSVNVDRDTKIMLVNVVYLNSRWLNSTYKRKLERRKFYISSSKMYFVPTIKFEKSTFIHGEIPHWNAKFIEIPFLDDNVTMIIFLPNENMELGNLEYLRKKLNLSELQSVRTAYTNKFEQDMELYLPKFMIAYHENMTDFFREVGVTTMFGDNADFTRLSEIPLKVNNIVQTVSVKINEGSSEDPDGYIFDRSEVREPVGPRQELVVDRPFHYLIEVYGEIMFAGTVRAPEFIFRRD
ncbi:antitrypsin-like [Formica exsecta]|uniref:antitrypsin-like n=1 Tax=Formica exsecta TaxID=72781 RepID=UPI001144BB4A|nr:antitrypsin-like [Formica exsecta]